MTGTPAGWPPPVTGSRRDATKADIDALHRRLVHSYGPPVTSASVYAQAVAAALHEALEQAEISRAILDRAAERRGQPGADLTAANCDGQIMLANRIMRRVFDAITPGEHVDPGHRLATRRALCGLTQGEVAAAGHVERSHYARIESGQYKLKADHARLFAAALGCTAEYLLTGKGGRP